MTGTRLNLRATLCSDIADNSENSARLAQLPGTDSRYVQFAESVPGFVENVTSPTWQSAVPVTARAGALWTLADQWVLSFLLPVPLCSNDAGQLSVPKGVLTYELHPCLFCRVHELEDESLGGTPSERAVARLRARIMASDSSF